jgi:tetratricopeptide (TPR) repeat protein
VHADTEARFTQHYTGIARKAGLSLDLNGEGLLAAVKHWIENQKNWLLILDNADNLTIFQKSSHGGQENQNTPSSPNLFQFIPECSGGAVIWTSRDGGIVGSLVAVKQCIHLSSMTKRESLKLLRSLTGCAETKEEAFTHEKELLDLLENLPLAFAQAAAYIRKTHVSVPTYITLLMESEERQSGLLGRELTDHYQLDVPKSIMQTWLISMAQIAKENPSAETILKTIAFFDNQGLPFELLHASAGEDMSEDEAPLAAGRLAQYSFLRIERIGDDGLPTYEQHRLVQLATRQSLNAEEKKIFFENAFCIITDLFPSSSHETWDSCNLYLPHSEKIARMLEVEGYVSNAPSLPDKMGFYYWQQGQSDKSEKLRLQVLELQENILGEKHPSTIRAMANLASTWLLYGQSEKAEKAERLELQVLELRKIVLGEKHPETLCAMANLATNWHIQGKSDKAEKLDIQVLELQKAVQGEHHRQTIIAMANLASTWRHLGKYENAEKLEAHMLGFRQSRLGEKHPDTISAMARDLAGWFIFNPGSSRFGSLFKCSLYHPRLWQARYLLFTGVKSDSAGREGIYIYMCPCLMYQLCRLGCCSGQSKKRMRIPLGNYGRKLQNVLPSVPMAAVINL